MEMTKISNSLGKPETLPLKDPSQRYSEHFSVLTFWNRCGWFPWIRLQLSKPTALIPLVFQVTKFLYSLNQSIILSRGVFIHLLDRKMEVCESLKYCFPFLAAHENHQGALAIDA